MAARIPTIQRRVATQAGPLVRVADRSVDNSGLARGLSNAAGAFFEIQQKEIEEANRTAFLNADNQMSSWQNEALYNPETGAFTRKGQSAINISQTTLDAYDKQSAAVSESLANDRQRQMFNEASARRRSQLQGQIGSYEFQQQQAYKNDVDDSSISLAANSAALGYNDPNIVRENLAKMEAVVDSKGQRLGWSPEEMQLNKLRASSGLLTGVIGRMVTDSPSRAREYLDASRDGLTADDQVRIETAIQREQKAREIEARQLQAISRAELSSRVQDASAAYLAGLDFDSPPTRAEFVNAYGAEDGDKRYAQMQSLQGVSIAIRDLATASPEERAGILSQYQPAESGVAREGFREDSQVYGVLANAATRLLKQQQDDPAAYAAIYSPTVQAAAAAMDQEGGAEEYAAATLAEQQRLGVENPKLLSNQQAAAIAARFQSTEDGGANSARLITELQQQWGKSWPVVFKQLQNELPGSAMVIGTGLDENTSARLARISGIKTEQLKLGLDSKASRDVREALNDQFAEFRNTLSGQVGGDRTFATMYTEAERLAYNYMGEGVSAKDAASRALKSFVEDKYSIRGTWRAPIGLDADLLERGSRIVQQEIDPASLQFAVPAGVSEEFAKDRVKTAIQRDGQWVTLPDESGLALYYGGEAVMGRDGQPITRSWDELTGLAAENPSAWDRFNQGREAQRDAAGQGGAMWRRGQ